MRSSVLFRVDINGLVHHVALIQRGPYARTNRRREWSEWTPECQPDEDWLILRESAHAGPATCLWCLVGERYK